MNGQLPIHETLEIHEILTFKTTCVTKSNNMIGLVSDPELKQIIQDDINIGNKHISELKNIIQNKSTLV